MATEVKVKIRHFDYADGEKSAKRGDVINVNAEDLERGKAIDAFASDAKDSESEEVDVVDLSDDELADWLEEESPNVKETVAAAGDDPESARRLLAAEESVSGGDPRQGVVDGLNKIIEGD